MGTYGEFSKMINQDSPQVFVLWIRMHLLPPIMQAKVLAKMKEDSKS